MPQMTFSVNDTNEPTYHISWMLEPPSMEQLVIDGEEEGLENLDYFTHMKSSRSHQTVAVKYDIPNGQCNHWELTSKSPVVAALQHSNQTDRTTSSHWG